MPPCFYIESEKQNFGLWKQHYALKFCMLCYLLITCYLLFAIYYLLFVVCYLLFVICYLLFVICYSICHFLFIFFLFFLVHLLGFIQSQVLYSHSQIELIWGCIWYVVSYRLGLLVVGFSYFHSFFIFDHCYLFLIHLILVICS